MTSAEPRTGRSAQGAGKPGPSCVIKKTLAKMAPKPSHDSKDLLFWDTRASGPTAVASNAPIANSHAREKVLK